MIEKEINSYVNYYIISCDYDCNNEEVYDEIIWQRFIRKAKEHGWLFRKIEDVWKHFCCEKCLKKFYKKISFS